jgi:ribosomal protein S18 acetylase RimI-like enzyme
MKPISFTDVLTTFSSLLLGNQILGWKTFFVKELETVNASQRKIVVKGIERHSIAKHIKEIVENASFNRGLWRSYLLYKNEATIALELASLFNVLKEKYLIYDYDGRTHWEFQSLRILLVTWKYKITEEYVYLNSDNNRTKICDEYDFILEFSFNGKISYVTIGLTGRCFERKFKLWDNEDSLFLTLDDSSHFDILNSYTLDEFKEKTKPGPGKMIKKCLYHISEIVNGKNVTVPYERKYKEKLYSFLRENGTSFNEGDLRDSLNYEKTQAKLLVNRSTDEIIACIIYHTRMSSQFDTKSDTRSTWVDFLCVRKDHRRMGIASDLLSKACDTERVIENSKAIAFLVNKGDIEAKKFLISLSYKPMAYQTRNGPSTERKIYFKPLFIV